MRRRRGNGGGVSNQGKSKLGKKRRGSILERARSRKASYIVLGERAKQ